MCIFCKIANGEIPCFKIAETDKAVAFLDLGMVAKGHTLVVPKKHVTNVLDASVEDLSNVAECMQKAVEVLKKNGVEALNVVNNSGEVAGQSVMHLHFHLIPRTQEDNLHLAMDPTNPEMSEVAKIYEQMIK